jgi:hypothetical protein
MFRISTAVSPFIFSSFLSIIGNQWEAKRSKVVWTEGKFILLVGVCGLDSNDALFTASFQNSALVRRNQINHWY